MGSTAPRASTWGRHALDASSTPRGPRPPVDGRRGGRSRASQHRGAYRATRDLAWTARRRSYRDSTGTNPSARQRPRRRYRRGRRCASESTDKAEHAERLVEIESWLREGSPVEGGPGSDEAPRRPSRDLSCRAGVSPPCRSGGMPRPMGDGPSRCSPQARPKLGPWISQRPSGGRGGPVAKGPPTPSSDPHRTPAASCTRRLAPPGSRTRRPRTGARPDAPGVPGAAPRSRGSARPQGTPKSTGRPRPGRGPHST